METLNNELVIEIKNLSKNFKELKAVDNLNINVFKGDVFGFLGPNGAGKSTTIRMLLTLIKPSGGSIKIFGKNLFRERLSILRNVGAIVEKPDFYGYLSAYKNLEILSRISGHDIPKKRIMEVLELVGLAERYKSKVKTFSHGMKQRLGLAQALLHDPDLIILDEPTTGLDPMGMKEIRDLIIHLSRDLKKTVFLSSHILFEVEQVANRMIIINKGTARVEGEVKELLNASHLTVTFEVTNIEKAKAVLSNTRWSKLMKNSANSKIEFTIDSNDVASLNRYLVENGIDVSSIIPTRSLEEYFLKITEEAS
ncbi:ABC transporter ATP-binding protein [Ignavibacterium sp.]|uniref:ABC transporter ATP-binding protein n=1 Tax=Ignavibacterium sp. TaxID=2651167 RepID=UPI00307F05B8